jgi:GT2 family glycosyltransferase
LLIHPESIAVVLPVHSRKEFTLDCLQSLFQQSVSGFKAIVVDSGSTDGTADAVEDIYPDVLVLRHGNLWWSRATNKGVERALADGAKYILTINDDLAFPKNYLQAMIRAAEQHPLAVMGSYAFHFYTHNPIYCGEQMNWLTARPRSLLEVFPPEQRHGLLPVSYFSARGLWLPAEVFGRVGLFDAQHLPHYNADHEFTARAAGAGFDVYVNCDAIIFNREDPNDPKGTRKAVRQYTWRNYGKHLFGFQGRGNVRYFIIFAVRHCPRRYLPLFLTMGIARRVCGYLRDWAVSKSKRGAQAT